MRSHSIGIEELAQGRTPPHHVDLARRLRAEKIEHQVTLEELQNLYAHFQVGIDKKYEKRGRQLLDMETFKCIMKHSMRSQSKSIEQIEQLFMKIDYEAVGRIRWDSVCTYLQLEYLEQANALARQKEASFLLPAVLQRLSYGGPVLRILSMPDDTLIMIREDGAIYFWSLQLKLKRKKRIFDKSMHQKARWVTDMISMPQYNKLIVATGNREIQLYELSNLEPYCQIGGLEAVPLKLDYCSVDPDNCLILYGDDQGCVNILFLASVGELLRTWKKMPKVENMPNITINNAITSPNVNYIRWKVHGDWVTQLNYYDSMKAVISSSNHESTALVIDTSLSSIAGYALKPETLKRQQWTKAVIENIENMFQDRVPTLKSLEASDERRDFLLDKGCTLETTNVKQKMKEIKNLRKDVKTRKGQTFLGLPQRRAECDQTVFRIYKGVKAFSFCKRRNLLLTGGMDRIIRVWNPYLPGKPTGMLRNHTAPVSYIHVSAEDNKIFSMSADNMIKIWDLETYCCLFTASSKVSGIKGELAACLYLPGPRALCVATDAAALLYLRQRSIPELHLALSHREPVVCCRYNPTFRQVVSCSEAAMVKIWDFETGKQLSEFMGAHGNAGITCLTFDSSGRRLVTGGRDGCLKIWSYNNGHCLHTLKRDDKQNEVCDCTYMEVNQNKYIIAVGWDRRINVYFDTPRDFHHFWKPQPPWQDDVNHGHKEDILCVAQCPPFLLATSSYDGEIIIWNVISGHIYCKLNTPSPTDGTEHREGPDRSVSCLAFLKTRAAQLESPAASLLANGPEGSVTFWRLFGGAGLVANFTPSKGQAQISSIAVTTGDALAYLADQQGFVHIYDIKEYGLQGLEPQPPRNVMFWRAHISMGTSLELIEEEKVLLSSSLDCTVRLWSRDGEFIGTFGQSNPWDIFTPASWSHPRIPCEILTDPQSMPAHSVLEGDVPTVHEEGEAEQGNPEKTSNPCSPKDFILETETKEDINQCRSPLAQSKPSQRASKPGWPRIYHTLQCHEVACVSALREKPDLSIIGSDLFNLNFPTQENEGNEAVQKEL